MQKCQESKAIIEKIYNYDIGFSKIINKIKYVKKINNINKLIEITIL